MAEKEEEKLSAIVWNLFVSGIVIEIVFSVLYRLLSKKTTQGDSTFDAVDRAKRYIVLHVSEYAHVDCYDKFS